MMMQSLGMMWPIIIEEMGHHWMKNVALVSDVMNLCGEACGLSW